LKERRLTSLFLPTLTELIVIAFSEMVLSPQQPNMKILVAWTEVGFRHVDKTNQILGYYHPKALTSDLRKTETKSAPYRVANDIAIRQ
jgi:hypothetical protein